MVFTHLTKQAQISVLVFGFNFQLSFGTSTNKFSLVATTSQATAESAAWPSDLVVTSNHLHTVDPALKTLMFVFTERLYHGESSLSKIPGAVTLLPRGQRRRKSKDALFQQERQHSMETPKERPPHRCTWFKA